MAKQFTLQNIEANKDYGGELAKYGLKSLNIGDALDAFEGGYEYTMGKLKTARRYICFNDIYRSCYVYCY